MIYRVKGKGTVLDFGSMQAAHQLLDNYPPHIKEQISIGEISAQECRTMVDNLTSDLSRVREGTQHQEWLLSRLEMYQAVLPVVEQQEADLRAKEAARIPGGNRGHS